MQQPILTTLLLLTALGGAAGAQGEAKQSALRTVRATFAAADLNRDGKLSQEEAIKASIPGVAFGAQDYDKDGAWSADEFLMYYRQLLKNGGRAADADLERQAARIAARRRAKEAARRREQQAKEAARKAAETPAAQTPQAAKPSTSLELGAEYRRAIAAVDKAVADGSLTLEEGLKQRNELIEQGRLEAARLAAEAASRQAPQAQTPQGVSPNGGVELDAKYRRAIEAVDQAVSEGRLTLEQGRKERDALIDRARAEAAKKAAETPAGQTPAAQTPQGVSPNGGVELDAKYRRAIEAVDQAVSEGRLTLEQGRKERDALIDRARAEAAKKAAETPAGQTPAAQTPQGVSPNSGVELDAKYRRAIEAVDQAVSEGRLTLEQGRKERDALIDRARAEAAKKAAETPAGQTPAAQTPQGVSPNGGVELDAKYRRAIEAVDQAVSEGRLTLEQGRKERDALIDRARAEAAKKAAETPAGQTPAAQTPQGVSPNSGNTLDAKARRALEAVDQAVVDGRLTAEQGQEKRAAILARARAAAEQSEAEAMRKALEERKREEQAKREAARSSGKPPVTSGATLEDKLKADLAKLDEAVRGGKLTPAEAAKRRGELEQAYARQKAREAEQKQGTTGKDGGKPARPATKVEGQRPGTKPPAGSGPPLVKPDPAAEKAAAEARKQEAARRQAELERARKEAEEKGGSEKP